MRVTVVEALLGVRTKQVDLEEDLGPLLVVEACSTARFDFCNGANGGRFAFQIPCSSNEVGCRKPSRSAFFGQRPRTRCRRSTLRRLAGRWRAAIASIGWRFARCRGLSTTARKFDLLSNENRVGVLDLWIRAQDRLHRRVVATGNRTECIPRFDDVAHWRPCAYARKIRMTVR